MKKSILFVTTPTSGSQSLWRLLTHILGNQYVFTVPTKSGQEKVSLSDLHDSGHVYMVRGTKELAGSIIDSRFRYIVNVRDPRDMLCNQYYWLTQHPIAAATDSEREKVVANRKQRFDEGIDRSVLRSKDNSVFSYFMDIIDAESIRKDTLFLSYNQLCCGFNGMLGRLCDFLQVDLDQSILERTAPERVENLGSNPEWIGQKWVGTDSTPGRFRSELKAETIEILNSRSSDILRALSSVELPEFRHFYNP